MTKQEILKNALSGRNQEVMDYQINIDNYRLAISHIDALPADEQSELLEFRELLAGLYKTSCLEQKKSIIMRDVIAYQIEE